MPELQTQKPTDLRISQKDLETLSDSEKAEVKQKYTERFGRATELIKKVNPELLEQLKRNGLTIEVVDNVHTVAESRFNQKIKMPVGSFLDAVTHTSADPKTGNAGQTTMLLGAHLFNGAQPNSTARLFVTLDHELHHCAAGDNPPPGTKMGTLQFPRTEVRAYTKSIEDLAKLTKQFDARVGDEPWLGAMAAALHENLRENLQLRDGFRALPDK